jgi:hypothetical protein
MSTSRSIQVSVTHTALGIAIGAAIEGLMPSFTSSASVANQAFETLVQVGLNGAALATVAGFLRDDDPTFGIPFSMALFQSQPELARRIEALSALAKAQVVEGVQRTAPRTAVL